jgi:hypothetical protein
VAPSYDSESASFAWERILVWFTKDQIGFEFLRWLREARLIFFLNGRVFMQKRPM